MKKFLTLVRNFFGFTRTQTNGFVVLILISTLVLFSNPIYKLMLDDDNSDFSQEKKMLDSLAAFWDEQLAGTDSIVIKKQKKASLFYFDPNVVTLKELDSLGFSQGLAKRLINYRTKAGSFKTKSDIKKLYGMDSVFWTQLYPFIQLPEIILENKKPQKFELRKEAIAFDLNLADTAQLKGVLGIGSVLAKRIIKYRDALGGFISKTQLNEVYGLDSTVVTRIEKASFLADGFLPKKLNINQLDERALSLHPYFSRKIAKVIVTYRFQHGNYASVEDLRKIEMLEKGSLDKVFPYLTVE